MVVAAAMAVAETAVMETAVAETAVEEAVRRAPAGRACSCSQPAATQADPTSVAEDLRGAHAGAR